MRCGCSSSPRVPTQPVSDYFEYLQRAGNIVRLGIYDAVPGHPDAESPARLPPSSRGLHLARERAIARRQARQLRARSPDDFFAGAGLARDLWGDRAGLWTAGIFAFYPRQLLMPLVLASENLFCPLLLLFVWIAAKRWRGDGRPARPAAAAGALGSSRSDANGRLLLGIVLLLGAVLAKVRWRAIAAELALLLLVEHLVMLPWAISQRARGRPLHVFELRRRHRVLHRKQPASDGRLARLAEGARTGAARDPLPRASPAIDQAAREEAVRWIRGHPGRAARLDVKKLWIILVQDRTIGWWAIYGQRIGPPTPNVDVVEGPHG